MAATGNGVWGIDIGQCGIKGLHGRLSSDGEFVEVDAVDYVQYEDEKILSQPDANPEELVRGALKEFLSRNSLRGDKVAVSISGQSGLARFIKLPPGLDAKKLTQLMELEAKNQIPFALEDVVWDYQRLTAEPGDDDDFENMPLSTEVGLFAMKRDQLLRTIQPYVDAEVEIDYIQLTPIAICNAIAFDRLRSDDGHDAELANRWIVILSMGTDSSDLVLTNGFRVWQRSIPLGGSHFTKQLTKELKLTFSKAENLKRNARESKDAKKIFQAMRPVFSDLETEVQRSIGYFRSLEKDAEIEQVVALGNAVKLPGLPQYLEKNLELKVNKLSSFERMQGDEVINDEKFKDNILAFPVCYGLVLQGLRKAQLATNLVPREIVRQRLIRRKKPWAAAIAAALLLACAANYFFHYRAYDSVNWTREVNSISWEKAKSQVQQVKSRSSQLQNSDTEQHEQLKRLDKLGEATVGSDDGRLLWLELLKTITECLPGDPQVAQGKLTSIKERPLEKRPEIYIDRIESKFYKELSEWNTESVQALHTEFLEDRAAQKQRNAEGVEGEEEAEEFAEEEAEAPPIEGAGWVIEIHGHHFQLDGPLRDKQYVRARIMEKLQNGEVKLVTGADGQTTTFNVKEMGILCPVLAQSRTNRNFKVQNQDYRPPTAAEGGDTAAASPFSQNPFGPSAAMSAAPEDPDNPRSFAAERFEFVIQFCWKQIPLKVRLKNRQEQAQNDEVTSL